MRIPKLEIKDRKTIDRNGHLMEGFEAKDHNYLLSAEDIYKSLEEVANGKVAYRSHYMSLLANAVELYYKGIVALSDKTMSAYTRECHNLAHLYSEITTHIMPIYPVTSRYEENAIYDYLKELSDLYIESRYLGASVSKNSFEESMVFLREQRDFVMSLVDPTKSWKKEDIFEKDKIEKE